MTRSNKGKTTLKSVRKRGNVMSEYDRLPCELRQWMAKAILPWRAKSVQAAYDKALSRTGDPDRAIEELNRIQAMLVSKDAARIWGLEHPAVRSG